jgi:hypothetical protein
VGVSRASSTDSSMLPGFHLQRAAQLREKLALQHRLLPFQ